MTDPKCLANHPVFLLGMPRSGTTWLSQIFESSPDFLVRLSPNYSHPLKNQIDLASTRADWVNQLAAATVSDDPFMTQDWRRDTGELASFARAAPGSERWLAVKDTRFHDLYQRAMQLLDEAKLIYVLRHPAGTINSWWSSEEFPLDADLSEQWRNGACRKDGPGEYWGFEDWRSVTMQYLSLEARDPDRYRVFRYEDLVADRHRVASELFAFVGTEPGPDTSAFLQESGARHDQRPYSVFKDPSVVDRWRNELPETIREAIRSELADTPLARFAQ